MHLSLDYSGPKSDVLDKLESDQPELEEGMTGAAKSAHGFERALRHAIGAHIEQHAAEGQVSVNVQVHARFRAKPAPAPQPSKPEGDQGGEGSQA